MKLEEAKVAINFVKINNYFSDNFWKLIGRLIKCVTLKASAPRNVTNVECRPLPSPWKRGQPGIVPFSSPDDYCSRGMSPFVPCLKKLSPSPKTIEVFGKPPPVPFPCYRGGDREGDPFIQCPLPSSSFSIIGCTAFLHFLVFFVTLCCFRTRGWWYYPRHVFSWHFNIFCNNWFNYTASCCCKRIN